VCVLKGSGVFAADLIRRIVAPIELTFIAAESYRDGTSAGRLDLLYVPREREIHGKDCLLVDDILDTGRTLAALRSELVSRGARAVRTCVFLDKPSRRSVLGSPDFRCFEVGDVFVVGYGLDFAGRYRNLPYVGALRHEVHAAPAPGRS
jgi:hypoxanthine phosphoribosyltransferase